MLDLLKSHASQIMSNVGKFYPFYILSGHLYKTNSVQWQSFSEPQLGLHSLELAWGVPVACAYWSSFLGTFVWFVVLLTYWVSSYPSHNTYSTNTSEWTPGYRSDPLSDVCLIGKKYIDNINPLFWPLRSNSRSENVLILLGC